MHASSQSAVLVPPRIARPRTSARWRGEEWRGEETTPESINTSVLLPSSSPNDSLPKEPDANSLRRLSRAKQHIRDAPAWLVSLVVHLVLLLTLALISTSTGAVGRILLTIQQGNAELTTELVEFSITPIELDDLPIEDSVAEVDVEIDVQPIELETSLQLASFATILDSLDPTNFQLPTELPATPSTMFAGRTGAMKEKQLRESGGTQATEDAVALGLEWLKRNQLKDGSWSLSGPYDSGARSENQVANDRRLVDPTVRASFV